jgi:hypothetical protein
MDPHKNTPTHLFPSIGDGSRHHRARLEHGLRGGQFTGADVGRNIHGVSVVSS